MSVSAIASANITPPLPTGRSWSTIFTSAAFVGTSITAPWQYFFKVPALPPGIALPRFYRLVYTISGSVGCTLNANLILNAPTVRDATLYGSNFVAI